MEDACAPVRIWLRTFAVAGPHISRIANGSVCGLTQGDLNRGPDEDCKDGVREVVSRVAKVVETLNQLLLLCLRLLNEHLCEVVE